MKTNFRIRNYKSSSDLSPIYLHISGHSKRERLNLDIHVNNKYWNEKTQRLSPVNNKQKDLNLILDNVQSKITSIMIVYRLSEKILTPYLLKKELVDGLPRVNFCAFFEHSLNDEKSLMKTGTYRRYKSVHAKLKKFSAEIIFTEITEAWFTRYRKYLKSLGNCNTTINANIIGIKKYLKIAVKSGIKLSFNLDDIKVGSTAGNRISLTPLEIKKAFGFYKSEYILENHRLILGYFLFSCMTGLRISDVQALTRNDIVDTDFSFVSKKTEKDQTIFINAKAKEIILTDPNLFIKKFSDKHLNEEIKVIMHQLGITKKISFHVARHTFATSFIRMGGSVEKLQILLGHSDIKQTMIYVHIVAQEANESIYLLDNLF